MDHCSAVLQGDLQGAIIEVTEYEEPVGVPRSELEAERYGVVTGSAWQLQEAGGVEEDREGVSLHAGEGQVTLSGHRKQRQEVKYQISLGLRGLLLFFWFFFFSNLKTETYNK